VEVAVKRIPARPWIVRTILLAVVACAASACATSRGIVDIRPGTGVAPADGPLVSLAAIEDKRHFEVAPKDPSIPSLKDRRIQDVAITSRAIARKRNTYGQALGDILLPEGRTVQNVIGEAVTRALHERGYRVVVASAEPMPGVDPLQVEILEMWSWFSPGFWALHLECRIHVRVTGSRPPFLGGKDFHGYIRLASQAATTGAWRNTIEKGVESLIADIEAQLAASPVSAASLPGPGR
jgi:hypothetical protein